MVGGAPLSSESWAWAAVALVAPTLARWRVKRSSKLQVGAGNGHNLSEIEKQICM